MIKARVRVRVKVRGWGCIRPIKVLTNIEIQRTSQFREQTGF